MAITYIGVAQLTTANPSGSSTVDFTSLSPAIGDLVLVIIARGEASDVDVQVTTSGYTEICDLYANDSNDSNLGVFYKVLTSVETSVTSSSAQSGTGLCIMVRLYRGCSTLSPLDVTSTTATGIDTGRPTNSSITPVTPGSLIVLCAGSSYNSATIPIVPTGYSQMEFYSFNTTRDQTVMACHKYRVSGTETPTQRGGLSTITTNSWTACTLALRPAPISQGGPSFLLFMD